MPIKTYNNVPMPSFMYGTAWKGEATRKLVELAVESGFRAIDTANQLKHYDEARVGDALLELAKKGIKRNQLFLQTKFTTIDGQDHRLPYDAKASLTDQVNQSIESSLNHLHVNVIDSYVLHGPHGSRGLGGNDWEVWTAMEELLRAKKTRIIGISNVSGEQLKELCTKAKVKPMVVQNRCYAAKGWDRTVREICQKNNIVYQGFSLLTANTPIMSEPAITDVAKRLGINASQVIFRFAMQIGMLPLTGTTNAQHMKEDLEAEKYELTPEEVKAIETVGASARSF